MAEIYKSPGVYRQEVFLKPPPVLQTGVPGFVGFAVPLPGGPAINQPVALNRKEEFSAQFSSLTGSYFADVVAGFFDNGGIRCYAVAANAATDPARGLVDAVAALAPLDDMDLVAVPDAATLQTPDKLPDTESILHVQSEVLKHCAEQGNRFAILDSWPGAGVDDVIDQCRQLTGDGQEPVNGALYYPWLIPAPPGGRMPPCGHVAGIYARSDVKTGIFKAPANEEILGVLDLEIQIDNNIQDKLNPERVNCLRAFPGRGIRVWGARTLGRSLADDDGSTIPEWLYVNVRRLFLTLRRWIDLQMGWATFEPNDFHLWVRIVRELTTFLTRLQRDGALQGTTPTEAFYVKCDAENNPPELRDLGQVMIEIGLAPLAPGEFIVVRVVRSAGGASQD